ncbi:MAG: toprim domain-containing protein [Bacteroidales bacterium]|jgi:hypothetical protein|nr:toprim domain-containing protein [Bacteroidales bacterium]
MEQQDLKAIKQIFISQYLSKLGIEPVKRTGRTLLYHAPYRTDNHPSFAVDMQKNTWHDFATGEGTSIIDLVMKMHNIDFKEAISHLGGQNSMMPEQVYQQYPVTKIEKEPGIVILKEKPLNNPALIAYLKERCIDIDIAQKHCKELYYMVGEKRYFGIGFKNDRGGYEIRNKYFKGATSKDITTICHKDAYACHIYEGFMDYLSHLTIDKHNMTNNSKYWLKTRPGENVIILNSVTNVNKAKDFLKSENQHRVTIYLDNDNAGRRVTKELRDFMIPEHLAIDASVCYQPHKDINDYLMSLGKQQKNTVTPKIKLS